MKLSTPISFILIISLSLSNVSLSFASYSNVTPVKVLITDITFLEADRLIKSQRKLQVKILDEKYVTDSFPCNTGNKGSLNLYIVDDQLSQKLEKGSEYVLDCNYGNYKTLNGGGSYAHWTLLEVPLSEIEIPVDKN